MTVLYTLGNLPFIYIFFSFSSFVLLIEMGLLSVAISLHRLALYTTDLKPVKT